MSHQTQVMVRRSVPGFLFPLLAVALTATLSSTSAFASDGNLTTVRKVLVLAPAVVNPDPQFNWLSAAMQQSLVADLTRHLPIQIETSASSTSDTAEATELAKKTGAARVIISTIQLAGDQIRVTGQILDVGNQHVLLALKATGRIDDLFEMEDQLASQATRGLIPPRPASKQVAPVIIAPSGPLRLTAGADSQAGLQYALPYESDRFQAAQDRYFFGSPRYGCGWCFGGWYGLGWGFSSYQPAAPGWAW